jgi:hypothetical protein
MGLDMYLVKRTYLGWNYDHRTEGKNLPDMSAWGIDSKRISYVEEQIMYWRKANAIHRWFVTNVQAGKDDCGRHNVSKEQIQTLLDCVEDIIDDPASAELYLPTAEGFFFGSTDYDEWYFSDLKHTKDSFKEILNNWDDTAEYYYHSSW